MKKRLVASVFALVLVLGAFLTGCSGKNTDNGDGTKTETKAVTGAEAVKNLDVRMALAKSIEKSFISDEILNNGAQAANYLVPGIITPGKDFRSAAPEGYNNYNLDEALAHWNKAKEDLGFDKVEIELLTFDSESSKKICEYLQAQWQANLPGISIVINQQPFENKLDLANAKKYEINFAGWSPDYPDPLTFLDMWTENNGHNNTGMANEKFDSIIHNATAGDLLDDIEKRWTELQEAERILFEEEAVIIPLFQKGLAIVQRPYLTNIVRPSYGADYIYEYVDTKADANGKKIVKLTESSDIPTMDLSVNTNSVSSKAIGNTIEGLFKYNEKAEIVNGLVKDYNMEEVTDEAGNKVYRYTFNLRQDSVWSNGVKVTAHDFEYSWKRLANPNTGAQFSGLTVTAGMKNAAKVVSGELEVDELGVKATDDYTLVVDLEKDVPFFTQLLVFPNFYPQNQEFVEAQGDKYGTTPETTLYNGPFTLSKWTLGYEFEYAKNPNYYAADSVKVDAINFRIIKDVSSAVNMYEAGEIDRTGLNSEFVSRYQDDPNFFTIEDQSVFYIEMNITK